MKPGILNLITLLLFILKLFKIVTFSWWIVFAPSILYFILLFIGLFIFVGIVSKTTDIINEVNKEIDN